MSDTAKLIQIQQRLQNYSPSMKKLKVGLNGFGRIGRAFTRIASNRDTVEIVAVNTRKTPASMMAYLLQYDSVYRKFNKHVTSDETSLNIDDHKIAALQTANPEEIPWDQYGVDVVVDATGAFTTTEDLKKHLRGSV